METRIFSNPGNSVVNIHDYSEAVRKGQIFKQARHNDELIVARDPDDKEYAVFYAKDALLVEYEKSKPYETKSRL